MRSPQPRIVHILARALAAAERWDEALRRYRWSLALEPGYAPAESGMGLALAAKGEWDAAERAFRASLGHQPSAEAQAGLAELLWRRGAQRDALRAQVAAYGWRHPAAAEHLAAWVESAEAAALEAAAEALAHAQAEAEARGDEGLARSIRHRVPGANAGAGS